jgi:hypothetical protein
MYHYLLGHGTLVGVLGQRGQVPVSEVLAEAGADLGAARRVPVDLDEAEDRREAAQEAEAGALRLTRGVRIRVQPLVGREEERDRFTGRRGGERWNRNWIMPPDAVCPKGGP